MNRRGFTIIELIITITVMGILMVLAVVNISSTQVSARDDERTADIQSIATALESFYATGTSTSTEFGRYPSTEITASEAALKASLRDVSLESFLAPGATSTTASFIASTNSIQSVTGVLPQPTISQYVYQPLSSTGALCVVIATECRKFNLFYRLEADNGIYKVTSKNQ